MRYAEMREREDFMDNAYLFVHFKGTESKPDDEQIYFAVSKDGLKWENVNGGRPVLRSDMGERGLRDPHILRLEDGGFALIATDLSIYGRRGMKNVWKDAQECGSKDIAVWRSDDLINWTEQKMVRAAADDAGCTWAPEAIYDREKGEYMVFWASKTADDGYKKQRIWRAYTKDFTELSKPEVYIDREYSVIDTTIAYIDGVYYRFTKDEDGKTVFLETAESLNGEFSECDAFSLKGERGYEGPSLCRVGDGYMLYMDNFATHEGYKTFYTDSATSADFRPKDGFETPDIFRHGTVMRITAEEYERLMKLA